MVSIRSQISMSCLLLGQSCITTCSKLLQLGFIFFNICPRFCDILKTKFILLLLVLIPSFWCSPPWNKNFFLLLLDLLLDLFILWWCFYYNYIFRKVFEMISCQHSWWFLNWVTYSLATTSNSLFIGYRRNIRNACLSTSSLHSSVVC